MLYAIHKELDKEINSEICEQFNAYIKESKSMARVWTKVILCFTCNFYPRPSLLVVCSDGHPLLRGTGGVPQSTGSCAPESFQHREEPIGKSGWCPDRTSRNSNPWFTSCYSPRITRPCSPWFTGIVYQWRYWLMSWNECWQKLTKCLKPAGPSKWWWIERVLLWNGPITSANLSAGSLVIVRHWMEELSSDLAYNIHSTFIIQKTRRFDDKRYSQL